MNILSHYVRILCTVLYSMCVLSLSSNGQSGCCYKINMHGEINKQQWYYFQNALEAARDANPDVIILCINTYGGAVNYADSIRSRILHSKVPIWAFIDNQAISAGALISIACDSIYMRQESSIGASTVVGIEGEQLPDKYQSFMRGMMRATAQAKGKIRVVNQHGDTVEQYRRNPDVAQAMVDPTLNLPGIIDSGHVLTLTSHEAQTLGYCEGIVNHIDEILAQTGYQNATLEEYNPSGKTKVKGFFLSPIVSGILIMLIVGGLYFELQTPGVGFPLIIALIAAVAYFLPLYLDGLIQNIDWILCLIGFVLLLLEIFVIPGFGIAGISGLICLVVGLTLAMVDNDVVLHTPGGGKTLLMGTTIVIVSITVSIFGCILLSSILLRSPRIPGLALHKNLSTEEGYIGVVNRPSCMVGKKGIASTVLRPSGKVTIEDVTYDAMATQSFIEAGTVIRVVREENNQLYVTEVIDDSPTTHTVS